MNTLRRILLKAVNSANYLGCWAGSRLLIAHEIVVEIVVKFGEGGRVVLNRHELKCNGCLSVCDSILFCVIV